ncbi:MAG TPA: ABC transporter permease [Gaiellaceae bacterium]|nr:ABC transporter permease [Gaiellaceae bacterium]
MFRYLVRRILWAALLFLVITFVTFVIFYVGPNNPARAVCGGDQAKRECLVRATAKLGLDQPMPVQYYKFLKQLVVHQDLGTSFATSQSVNQRIKEAAPVTASLVFGGAVLWMMIGLSVGIYSALKPRSLIDRSAMVFVLIGVSAHPIWIGLIFEYIFGVKLGWTPIANYANFFGAPPDSGLPGGPWQWFYHLILPWCTFALLFAALYVRMIRANVMETLNEDYVRTARAKGAPEGQVIRSHVLRNALLPVVTMLGMDIGIALGGAIFTETVYQLPGLGQTAIIGIGNQDLAIVQGVVVFATLAIIVFNLIVDLLYAWIDPRIRLT